MEAPPQNPGGEQTSPHNPLPPVGGQGSPHHHGASPPHAANPHMGVNPHIVLSGQGNAHPGSVNPQAALGGQGNHPVFIQPGQQFPPGPQMHHMGGQGAPLGGGPTSAEVGGQGEPGDGMTMPQQYMQ